MIIDYKEEKVNGTTILIVLTPSQIIRYFDFQVHNFCYALKYMLI